ncbi:type I-E CRISPR-associated protein Cas7/Cse4/CasC [Saccharopolyspora sp. ID03-671]|uniref:type I-E CRISPR-associated protein Cas7/Cse4/CasC n=1 Tax=Saccharopolyspora sp. ID03-671 TaxID=3073066 RepID=UPI003253C61C
MILELHLLQSFPVSNLNRDDLGAPKSATFGGVPRARVSSQALKRAARDEFIKHGLDKTDLGDRTKRIIFAASDLLSEDHQADPRATDILAAGLAGLGFGVVDTRRSQYLLFIGNKAAHALAEYCEQNWDDLTQVVEAAEKEAKKATSKKKANPDKDPVAAFTKSKKSKDAAATRKLLDASYAADIGLFGRMIADNTEFNIAAASQVAHALSTHAVTTEFDYYTAVDDLKKNDEPGADMIGTIDFNTACYYRYANLDLTQLRENLAADDALVAKAAQAWLGAFIDSTPTGKQSTTAARTMPETLLGTVRDRGAWNLANAFLKPVTGHDLMTTSTQRLFEHFQTLRGFYGSRALRTVAGAALTSDTAPLPAEERVDSLDTFTSRLLSTALDTTA